MKRIKRQFVSIFLITSLLLGVFGINASATVVEYNTVAHHHFKVIDDDIPENVNGSCTLVATSLLLSFYDSYWHDGFIAENYEDTSPSCSPTTDYPNGVPTIKTENIEWDNYEENGGSYSDFIYSSNSNGSLIDQYFHLYLLSLCIAQGLYEDESRETFATSFDEMAFILDLYFDVRFGPNDYVIQYGETNTSIPLNIYFLLENSTGSNRNTIHQIIREQVEMGNPVLYCGFRPATDEDDEKYVKNGKVGHSMVAYNVEDNGDIELHTGHTNNPHSSINDTDYNLNIGVLWIEINEEILQHSCSDNYFWYPTRSNICSCNAYKYYEDENQEKIYLHPEHTHSSCGELVSRTAETHTYPCYCGQDVAYSHNFIYTSINSMYHSATCTTCGYTYTEMHPGANAINKPRLCSKCQYVFVTFEPWGDNAPPAETD